MKYFLKYLAYLDIYFYDYYEIHYWINNQHFRGIAVRNVYLSNNELTTISFSLLPWDKLDTIQLDGNPWHCDCDLSWLVYNKNHTLISGIDYDYLICKSPEILADLPVKHLSRYNFGCSKFNLTIYIYIYIYNL